MANYHKKNKKNQLEVNASSTPLPTPKPTPIIAPSVMIVENFLKEKKIIGQIKDFLIKKYKGKKFTLVEWEQILIQEKISS